MDRSLEHAIEIIVQTRAGQHRMPVVRSFFDEATFTASYVVHDPISLAAAIIDPVLDFNAPTCRYSSRSAEAIVAYIESEGLSTEWLLETHAHADHLSAAPFLQARVGGTLAIGRAITTVQQIFGDLFNAGPEFARDGSQFDHLFDDGEEFIIGSIGCRVLDAPGHTPAGVAYVIGDSVFCGNTLFMPDYGTARTDLPGGDARQLFRSIRRLLCLPDEARLFLSHDYKAPGRDTYAWETTIGAERIANVHARDGITEGEFVAARTARDATLALPKLILQAMQVNMRAGALPPVESNGKRYLRIPLNTI
ncbi:MULTISPECIES: MBL fold metallo-hydrolase [unclassified Paraburkholderia]|uniref:MBL fold metallo-hydrolase n=1 Tax=unclassified Paraburkholderia TaxID=2615204 RepID=UPI002AB6D124|nr:MULTISPECIES: MBL fold metallo-hydrolase [unclassified Paraburkholderia]